MSDAQSPLAVWQVSLLALVRSAAEFNREQIESGGSERRTVVDVLDELESILDAAENPDPEMSEEEVETGEVDPANPMNFSDYPASIPGDNSTASPSLIQYAREVFERGFGTNQSSESGSVLGREIWFSDTYTFLLEFTSEKDDEGVYARRRTEEFQVGGVGTNNNGEDIFGNEISTFFAAAEGVDEFTWLFLQGAWYVNLSSNGQVPEGEVFGNRFGLFGRAYNDTQYLLRFGETLSPEVGRDSVTALASDHIAYFIAEDVTIADGVPTLFQLGVSDGQTGARGLWFDCRGWIFVRYPIE